MMLNCATGWVPDFPDYRDFTIKTTAIKDKWKKPGIQKESIKGMLEHVGVIQAIGKARVALPKKMDLRAFCTPVDHQGNLNSCTAHAAAGLLEYFECRAFGKFTKPSRLFIYKTTRNLLRWKGDQGAVVRSTMGAMALFGAPPEEYWPYEEKGFDKEPPAFCYSFAQNYQALNYFRIDRDTSGKLDEKELLHRIKINLKAGLPMMFGFSVFESVIQAEHKNTPGRIPYPADKESSPEGHAVLAVGYDDTIRIRNTLKDGKETSGALLIRNSWGDGWGESGYGWLPYDYVLKGMTADWWGLLKNEWIDTEQFQF
jgi:C1A family cysteine protease